MTCPVCGDDFKVELPELEVEILEEGGNIESQEFYCTECGKSFYIGG